MMGVRRKTYNEIEKIEVKLIIGGQNYVTISLFSKQEPQFLPIIVQ